GEEDEGVDRIQAHTAAGDGHRFAPPLAGRELGRGFEDRGGGRRGGDGRCFGLGLRRRPGRRRGGVGLDRNGGAGGGGEQVGLGLVLRRGRLGLRRRRLGRPGAALQRRRRGEADQVVVIVRRVRIAGFGHGGPSCPRVQNDGPPSRAQPV